MLQKFRRNGDAKENQAMVLRSCRWPSVPQKKKSEFRSWFGGMARRLFNVSCCMLGIAGIAICIYIYIYMIIYIFILYIYIHIHYLFVDFLNSCFVRCRFHNPDESKSWNTIIYDPHREAVFSHGYQDTFYTSVDDSVACVAVVDGRGLGFGRAKILAGALSLEDSHWRMARTGKAFE